MLAKMFKEALDHAFEDFVDLRIGDALGALKDDPNSPFSKEVAEYNQLFKVIRELLGPENKKLISRLDGSQCNYNCTAYNVIYRQAFQDALNCKDIITGKDVICNEQHKAS